jgi:hypothetical protein
MSQCLNVFLTFEARFLPDTGFLVGGFFSILWGFSTFNTLTYCFLASKVSDENSADNLIEDLFYVTSEKFQFNQYKQL